jgi:hypothetical protein
VTIRAMGATGVAVGERVGVGGGWGVCAWAGISAVIAANAADTIPPRIGTRRREVCRNVIMIRKARRL